MRNVHHRPIRFGVTLLTVCGLLAGACRLFTPDLSSDPAVALTVTAALLASLPVSAPTGQPTGQPIDTQAATPAAPPRATPSPVPPTAEPAAPTPTLEALTDLRQQLTALLDSPLPEDAHPALRVAEFTSAEGVVQQIPYVVNEQAGQDGSEEQLFLIAHSADGQPQALLLAPPIQGLRQQPGPDGRYVYYYDEKGNWLLRADARPLDKENNVEEALIEMLGENDADSLYRQADIYPRFYFNLPGVPSSFFLVEKLTLNQIKLLIATFQAFDQEPFAGLKEFTFTPGDNVPFLISREDHPFAAALALPMGGDPRRGIILLYSRNLFASKYETVGSIAHEVVHIWQGAPPGCDKPQGRLEREIGQGAVPADLYDWEARQIIEQASQSRQLGAYHMSLWVAMHYNLQDAAKFYRSIITTGTANGQSIINCGK